MTRIIKSSLPVAEDVEFDNSTNGFVSDNVQDAIEEVQNKTIGAIFNVTFNSSGIVFGTDFLSYSNDLATSDETPFVIPFSCELVSITYTNEDPNTDGTIFIQKSDFNSGNSDSTVLSYSFTNVRTFVHTNFTKPTFSPGDKIAVALRDDGTNPDEPRIELFFQISDTNITDFEENWSGDF